MTYRSEGRTLAIVARRALGIVARPVEEHDERNPAVMAPTVSVGTSGMGSDEWV